VDSHCHGVSTEDKTRLEEPPPSRVIWSQASQQVYCCIFPAAAIIIVSCDLRPLLHDESSISKSVCLFMGKCKHSRGVAGTVGLWWAKRSPHTCVGCAPTVRPLTSPMSWQIDSFTLILPTSDCHEFASCVSRPRLTPRCVVGNGVLVALVCCS
jgi:hypothetical protein